jgi:hypothetical protein
MKPNDEYIYYSIRYVAGGLVVEHSNPARRNQDPIRFSVKSMLFRKNVKMRLDPSIA